MIDAAPDRCPRSAADVTIDTGQVCKPVTAGGSTGNRTETEENPSAEYWSRRPHTAPRGAHEVQIVFGVLGTTVNWSAGFGGDGSLVAITEHWNSFVDPDCCSSELRGHALNPTAPGLPGSKHGRRQILLWQASPGAQGRQVSLVVVPAVVTPLVVCAVVKSESHASPSIAGPTHAPWRGLVDPFAPWSMRKHWPGRDVSGNVRRQTELFTHALEVQFAPPSSTLFGATLGSHA
ncbi:MAG: hypothetical protein U0269_30795 [Polyangiales bacterium]